MTATSPTRAVIITTARADELVPKTRLLEADGDIAVVGHGPPLRAARILEGARPDVALIDAISRREAVDIVQSLMREGSVPLIVVGDPSDGFAQRAKDAGALDVVAWPRDGDGEAAGVLRRRIRTLSRVVVVRRTRRRATAGDRTVVVGMAASTGGPEALSRILSGLGNLEAPVLIVQHMHQDFLDRFVEWMQSTSTLDVVLATTGTRIRASTVYVAPNDSHLTITEDWAIALIDEPVGVHRPSADMLFQSLAQHAGSRAIGVLLTGMGEDGAAGLLSLRQRGGMTVVQDEATSAVFGMPRAAQLRGAASRVLPLGDIASAVVEEARRATS